MALLYSFLFTEDLGFKPDYMPSRHATLQSLTLGIIIPVISSIIPIRTALSKSLADSLIASRSKISGIIVIYTDKKNLTVGPYVLLGSLALLYGVSVYYFLPKAMLDLKLNLML